MSPSLVLAIVCAAFAGGVLADRGSGRVWPRRRGATAAPGSRRILLPFAGMSISGRSLDAALRLARAEHATLMPTFLARVPRTLPLDAPLALQCERCMPLLEAIEQRAHAEGVAVDTRISRGRTYRDALRHQLEQERVDRVVVSATTDERTGLNGEDLRWLLQQVSAEVLILRAGLGDERTLTAAGGRARARLNRAPTRPRTTPRTRPRRA